ncbi:MAG: CoA transferase [Tepidiformaceae bacterium]
MELLPGARFTVASYGVAAAYAGWLLRQFGAEVEQTTALDPEGLGAFLGEGTRFDGEPGFDGAGTLITDAPVTAANRTSLATEARRRQVVWLTPWGFEGPWSGRRATDLGLHAAGGWMSAVGEPGREPLGPPGAQGQFTAGLFAAIEATMSLAGLAPTAPGLSGVSMAEAVLATMIYDPVGFQYHGIHRERAGNRFSGAQATLATLPCKDGWIGLHVALHPQWLRLCEVIGHPELPSDARFADSVVRAQNMEALDGYLLPWLAERTRFEVFHTLQAARIPCSAHPDVAEVLDSPQLRARGAWHTVATAAGRQLRVAGAPARVREESLAAGQGEHPDGPWAPGRVRVVDLSMGWAGPLVGHILACYGADVIKVESHRHFDWWRGSRPPGDDPTNALHEHSHVFNATNRGKRGLTLDLATALGKEVARQLIGSADVVIENFAAGVLEKLGLSYDVLSAENPGLILLRQPGFGSDGPEASYQAFGNTIEGMSGLTALMGYEDGPPCMLSNALGDPISGLTGTVAVVAGLAARARDGRGRCIEAAQLEGFLPLVTDALIRYQREGAIPSRQGNRRAGSEPSGLFPCAGDDRWVAIEVATDAEWAALSALIVSPWAAEARFATAEGRAAHRGLLSARLAEWTANRDRDDLAAELQAAGVAAAPMHSDTDVLGAEPFASAGFWEGSERAHVGYHLYPSLPIVRDGVRPRSSRPAPLLGEHNEEVLAGLGLSAGEIAALREEAVIGEIPG